MMDLQTQIEIAEDYKKRNNLADLDLCMEIVDWWNELVEMKDLNMIQKFIKLLQRLLWTLSKPTVNQETRYGSFSWTTNLFPTCSTPIRGRFN